MQDDAFALIADSSDSDLGQLVQSPVGKASPRQSTSWYSRDHQFHNSVLRTGYDITAATTVTLAAQSVGRIPLNLKVAIPRGFYLQLAPLVSLTNKGLSQSSVQKISKVQFKCRH